MWKKLGRLIINNFGLKVLAVVFAIILWLVIVNTEDPEKAATFTIPIEVVNSGYLADENLTYEILDNNDTISFTVSGKRSVVENLTADDFRAVANMENIDETMTMVPISLTATSYNSQLEITRRQSYLMVSVEPLVTKEFEIMVAVEGSPEGDYFVESTEASPNVVTVSGAKSLVEEIDSVWTSINVYGKEETFSDMETIYLLDESGSPLDTEHLDLDVPEVRVTANILLAKSVPIVFDVVGEPANGYCAAAPECEIDSLTIAGLPEVLDEIEDVEFISSALSVEGAARDVSATLSVERALPEGVTLYGDEPDQLTVLIPIEPAATREVEMSADNITFVGLADDLTITILTDPLTAKVTGLEDEISRVGGTALSGTVDVSGLGEGFRMFDVELETDGSYTAETRFSVHIEKKDESGD